MGRKLIDLTGAKINKFTVLERAENDKRGKTRWLCQCECGNIKIVGGSDLKNGTTKSCGCLRKERMTTHGKGRSRLYEIWAQMKQRCTNPNAEKYKNYGKRNITICDEWANDYGVFYEWAINNGYQDNLTIDRIDNDKGYYPENCQWTTNKVQSNNRTNNHMITYQNKTLTLAQWCEELGLKYARVNDRINKLKWTVEDAFTLPFNSKPTQ